MKNPDTLNIKQAAGSRKHDAAGNQQSAKNNQQDGYGASTIRRRKRNYVRKILNDPLVMNA